MKENSSNTIKRRLSISILDEDSFYTQGLKIALSTHFSGIDTNIKFAMQPSNDVATDIIFQAIRCGTITVPRSQCRPNDIHPLYFAIIDNKSAHLQHLYREVRQTNIIHRQQSVEKVIQLIDKSLLLRVSSFKKTKYEQVSLLNERLTLREKEVLSHLKQGKTHSGTAHSMGLKEKTISTHKRSAMKKLNFRRTSELLHWMLLGGLSNK